MIENIMAGTYHSNCKLNKKNLKSKYLLTIFCNFEVKEASGGLPNPCGRLSARFPILPEAG